MSIDTLNFTPFFFLFFVFEKGGKNIGGNKRNTSKTQRDDFKTHLVRRNALLLDFAARGDDDDDDRIIIVVAEDDDDRWWWWYRRLLSAF